MSHKYENWRHVSIISDIELRDANGNALDVSSEAYIAFAGYVSSRPTRLIACTVPWQDNDGNECVIVGINSRWNEKVVDLYENIYFQGTAPDSATQLSSYGPGGFPVEGWTYKEVTVSKDSDLNPHEIESFIHFENENTSERVSVRWTWLVDF